MGAQSARPRLSPVISFSLSRGQAKRRRQVSRVLVLLMLALASFALFLRAARRSSIARSMSSSFGTSFDSCREISNSFRRITATVEESVFDRVSGSSVSRASRSSPSGYRISAANDRGADLRGRPEREGRVERRRGRRRWREGEIVRSREENEEIEREHRTERERERKSAVRLD